MASTSYMTGSLQAINSSGHASSGSKIGFTLNSAYVHRTSGQAMTVGYRARNTNPINEFYCMVDVTTGTRASIALQCDIYDSTSAAAARPGTGLLDSSTSMTYPSSDLCWIKFDFATPHTPALNDLIWFVIHNTSASPTVDYPAIVTTTDTSFRFGCNSAPSTSTVGFSVAGTSVVEMPFVVVQGTEPYGQPIGGRSSTTYTNNTLERGFVLPAEVGEIPLEGWNILSNVLPGKIYSDGVAPGGTALYTFPSLTGTGSQHTRHWFDSSFTLNSLGGTPPWKVVFATTVNSQGPTGGFIYDYSSYSTMFDKFADGINFVHGVQDNGAGGWNYFKNYINGILLFAGNYTAPTGGGLLLPRGFNGGLG
jgi:hypothetical protein